MRRWGHGHSLTGGALLALSLERHALTALLVVALAGFVAGRWWSAGAGLVRTAAAAAAAAATVWSRSRKHYRIPY